jgi:hypothetical protein
MNGKLIEKYNYDEYQLINEKPKNNYTEKLYEISDLSKFNMYENLNDGIDIDFKFDVKINGESLNEIYQYEKPKPKIVKEIITENTSGVISWEMFNRINEQAFLSIQSEIKRKL